MAAVAQWLLVLALLVVRSQGQSEGIITGLVDSSTLVQRSQFPDPVTGLLSFQLSVSGSVEIQFLFPGLRFECSGNVTKWVVGAEFGSLQSTRDPALGIYRDRPGGGGFADRVGGTVFVQPNDIDSNIYEFTPVPPLPFRANDCLGIYLPAEMNLRARPQSIGLDVTDGPASRSYIVSNPPAEGLATFDVASDPTEENDFLPLVAVEIESDDPDSADCTRGFISRELLEVLAPGLLKLFFRQIIFPSYNFTSDGFITSWTVSADWQNDGTRFPELQIWRGSGEDTYDKIASTELTATAESPNQLYSGTIDPPLQFQSGDVLGMYLPSGSAVNSSRLLIYLASSSGPEYKYSFSDAPLSRVVVSELQTDNDRPLLALEMSPSSPTRATSPPTATDSPTTSPPTMGPCPGGPNITAIIVLVLVVVVAAFSVTVIIVAVVFCVRRRRRRRRGRGAKDTGANIPDEPYYSSPLQQETTVFTKSNEAYATTTITTEQNEAYGTTLITTERNEAYGTALITTEQNEAYTLPTASNAAYNSRGSAVPLQSNEAYSTSGRETATHEYDYVS